MNLSKRLAAIRDFIPPGAVVADIGTDHAALPLELVNIGRCPRAIATDINEKPYHIARAAVEQRNLKGSVEVRRGDGLRVLTPGEADVLVLAGMGGGTIIKILEDSQGVLAGVKRLVLQPMTDTGEVRLWLAGSGWRIVEERLVSEEGKLYAVMAAEPGENSEEDSFLLELGPLLVKGRDPLLGEYLESLKANYQKVLAGLTRSRSEHSMEKAFKYTARLARLGELIGKCR